MVNLGTAQRNNSNEADGRASSQGLAVQTESDVSSMLEGTQFSSSNEKLSELQREQALLTRSNIYHEIQTNGHTEIPTESPDPRLIQMQQQQQVLREKLEQQQVLIRGAEFNITSTQKELLTGGMTGFFMWSSGTKVAMNKDLTAMREMNKVRVENAAEMASTLKRQEEAAKQFSKLEQQGKDLQSKGDLVGAQEAFNAAQKVYSKSIGTKQPELVVDNENYRQAQRDVSNGLSQSIDVLNKTETVLRTTQKVAIVAGATVATGGAALAVGGVAGAAVGVAAGTTYGTAVGASAALTEATGHVALGNKTADQALADAGNQTLESARDSAIASVGAVVGIGVGGKVASSIATRLSTSNGAKIVTALANGTASGASSATVSTTAYTGIEYVEASREFAKQYDSINMSSAERELAYTKFMEKRGLTFSGIAQRYAHDVSIGAFGGAIGGAAGAGKDLAATSRRAALSIEGGQLVVDVGVGLGDAALHGQFNTEGITSSIAGVTIGNVSGRVSHRNHTARQTNEGNDSPPPATTNFNNEPEPIIYRIEDYREKDNQQSQPQSLGLAVGAESMSTDMQPQHRDFAQKQVTGSATIKIHKGDETKVEGKSLLTDITVAQQVELLEPRNPDVGVPQTEDIKSFLESEKRRTGSFGDPSLDQFTSDEVAIYMQDKISSLGELAPEAMLVLRSEKRLGTKIESNMLAELLENPSLLIEAIYEARKSYTDSSNGPVNPLVSAFPDTVVARQSFDQLRSIIKKDLGIEEISINERRGRFTGLLLESTDPSFELRYDNPHTLRNGLPVSIERTRTQHGPGGDKHHIDVINENHGLKLRYFKGDDDQIYLYDENNNQQPSQLFQLVEGHNGASWQMVSINHNYRLDK